MELLFKMHKLRDKVLEFNFHDRNQQLTFQGTFVKEIQHFFKKRDFQQSTIQSFLDFIAEFEQSDMLFEMIETKRVQVELVAPNKVQAASITLLFQYFSIIH